MVLGPHEKLGPYEILALLGKGGMGEVYLAADTRDGKRVAIKLLPRKLAADAGSLKRFQKEARLMGSLEHPHIAACYSLEQTDGLTYLVLEFVEGETLAEHLARGPAGPLIALRFAGQIAQALAATHAKGVIHRDIKPGNIKVTPRGDIKVLDFGLAKHTLPRDGLLSTATRGLVGTPAYMSPEQLRGELLDHRTDIWSMGCVLFELLAGREPFQGPTLARLLDAIVRREPRWELLPSGLPEGVVDLIRRCLRKEASDRWESAEEFGRQLHGVLLALAPPSAGEPAAPDSGQATALDSYRQAAERGEARAQYALGRLYGSGQDVPQDYTEALRWHRKAADQGLPEAQAELGALYLSGKGANQDSVEALRWFRKAADQGHSRTQFLLGRMYAGGRGVPQDLTESVRWTSSAASRGLPEAQTELGCMYYSGAGAPRDADAALLWWRRAAEQGHPRAQYLLGRAYATGRGPQQDFLQAYLWLDLAAASPGVPQEYVLERDQLARAMSPQQLSEARRLIASWKPQGQDAQASKASRA